MQGALCRTGKCGLCRWLYEPPLSFGTKRGELGRMLACSEPAFPAQKRRLWCLPPKAFTRTHSVTVREALGVVPGTEQ